jgi:hypothetical protein
MERVSDGYKLGVKKTTHQCRKYVPPLRIELILWVAAVDVPDVPHDVVGPRAIAPQIVDRCSNAILREWRLCKKFDEGHKVIKPSDTGGESRGTEGAMQGREETNR